MKKKRNILSNLMRFFFMEINLCLFFEEIIVM